MITIRFGVNKRQNDSTFMAAVYLRESVLWILTTIPSDSVFAGIFFNQQRIPDQTCSAPSDRRPLKPAYR